VKNDMPVGTALYLLQRAGFIQRDYRQGSRTYTTRLAEPQKSFDELDIDFERLDTKRERDFAKLRRMIDYADHPQCRHHFVLAYFGDTEAEERCNVCDNCLAQVSTAVRLPSEEETVIIQKALSCVARTNGRFGRGRIAQTLVGSRSKEVIDARLDRLPTYGLLAEVGPDYVWSLLDVLIKAGCITVSSGQYPTISLSELGGDVMRRKRTIPLVMPAFFGSTKAASPRNRKMKKPASGNTVQEAPYNEKLFEELRRWRREKAAGMGGLPEYLVYPNETLKELCRRLPNSEAELLDVRGIGPAKARQFGRETLQVLQKFAA
jgi:ATP-dependent DNA helicase RecQ